VLVTGRVVGANWFRVETDDGKIGYVYGPNLRKPEGAPVASGRSSEPAATQPAAAQAPPAAPERAPERLAAVPPAAALSPPAPPARSAVFKDCENCPEMVALPAGSFMMGSADGDASERPVHRVTLGAFALGRTAVTAKLWMACVGDGGCAYRPRTDLPDTAPMNNLSWQDAQHYVEWLAKTTGRPYRLPTEAEWEYAARAGTETRYWWGGQPGVAKADCKGCGGDWNTARPAAAGSFAPNPFGLYDMNGGVAQWVADCWYPTYDKAPADGSARGGSCTQHVLRGGAWKNDPSYLRSSSRAQYDTDVRYITNGLRVAKTLP
jgi:formylglycine-generating enzyme required for sulfatase activity